MDVTLRELYEQEDAAWGEYTAFSLMERRTAALRGWEGDGPVCDVNRRVRKIQRQVQEHPERRDFEADLRETLGVAISRGTESARDAYGALCNVGWEHENGTRFSCTWRHAGALIAEIRDCGEEYLDWYCSGNEGHVSVEIADALAARGWTYREL